MRLHGQAVKTSPFHGGNTGSIPVGVTSDQMSTYIVGKSSIRNICPQGLFGPLAQLVRATGSYPVGPGFESPKVHSFLRLKEAINLISGPVAQLVRAPPCHGGGRGFESHPGRLVRRKVSSLGS